MNNPLHQNAESIVRKQLQAEVLPKTKKDVQALVNDLKTFGKKIRDLLELSPEGQAAFERHSSPTEKQALAALVTCIDTSTRDLFLAIDDPRKSVDTHIQQLEYTGKKLEAALPEVINIFSNFQKRQESLLTLLRRIEKNKNIIDRATKDLELYSNTDSVSSDRHVEREKEKRRKPLVDQYSRAEEMVKKDTATLENMAKKESDNHSIQQINTLAQAIESISFERFPITPLQERFRTEFAIALQSLHQQEEGKEKDWQNDFHAACQPLLECFASLHDIAVKELEKWELQQICDGNMIKEEVLDTYLVAQIQALEKMHEHKQRWKQHMKEIRTHLSGDFNHTIDFFNTCIDFLQGNIATRKVNIKKAKIRQKADISGVETVLKSNGSNYSGIHNNPTKALQRIPNARDAIIEQSRTNYKDLAMIRILVVLRRIECACHPIQALKRFMSSALKHKENE